MNKPLELVNYKKGISGRHMGKLYESLKEVVKQRSKNIPVVLAGVKDTHALILNENAKARFRVCFREYM